MDFIPGCHYTPIGCQGMPKTSYGGFVYTKGMSKTNGRCCCRSFNAFKLRLHEQFFTCDADTFSEIIVLPVGRKIATLPHGALANFAERKIARILIQYNPAKSNPLGEYELGSS